MRPKIKTFAKWFTLGGLFIIIATDIILWYFGYTISEIVRDYQWWDKDLELNNLWSIGFYLATILGHWTINIYSKEDKVDNRLTRFIILVVIWIAVLISNFTIFKETHIPWYLTIPGGLAAGAYLWPLKKKEK